MRSQQYDMANAQHWSYSKTLKADRELDPAAMSDAIQMSVALGGNCSPSFLIPGLRVALAAEGITAKIHETAYDGWIPSALAPDRKVDVWILWFSSLGQSNGGTTPGELNLDAALAAIEAVLARGERVIAILPEALEIGAPYSSLDRWRRQLSTTLDSALPPSVVRIDPDRIHRTIGDAAWFAGRYWTLAKSPCHPDAATGLGHFAANVIGRLLKPKVKAVAVDLDGTLWGGIVGEAGTGGIGLDPNAGGRPYLQLQRFLKDLSERGIPISVVSKNNMADALAPFVKRSEMILKRDDIVYFHANWDNKANALKKIAADLNIGLDALCFIDDSVHERAEARALLPDLIVPDLPEDPEARIGFLQKSNLFLQPVVAKEDSARVEYYKSQALRETLAAEAGDIRSYFRGLEMKLVPIPIGPDNIQRVTSLIHKTNQFNLTTRRHSDSVLAEIISAPESFSYCYRLTDRFGDACIIAVVLGLREAQELTIDTWLMSCRVINRTVEEAILDHLLTWCRGHNVSKVNSLYVPSAKNDLVADLYDRLGFAPAGDDPNGRKFSASVDLAPSHTITIVADEKDAIAL